ETAPNSPAEIAGVMENDKIVAVNQVKINSWSDMVKSIENSNGDPVDITLIRDNKEIQKSIIPQMDTDNNRFMIGIIPVVEKSLFMAIKDSYIQIKLISIEMINFFKGLITSGATDNTEIVGPVGIISLVGQASKDGLYNVLFLAGLISINLGFINLLPIPALDGSRILFLIFEFLRGKPIDPEKEAMIHAVGLALMMALMLMITYKDILAIFKG
ncbi:MAG: RIP metalloprotease RseP, partial [Clostridiales bacterium]|nr:RIP metalloprotease RseP [Clostridiales bacterium]